MDDKDDKPPEFETFRDLTRKLLDVSKQDLDQARRDSLARGASDSERAELNWDPATE
jgi:hypothetical protein